MGEDLKEFSGCKEKWIVYNMAFYERLRFLLGFTAKKQEFIIKILSFVMAETHFPWEVGGAL